MMKTLAAILTQTGKPLELDEIEIPQLRTGQVLVEVDHSGICGTQLLRITAAFQRENKPSPGQRFYPGSG